MSPYAQEPETYSLRFETQSLYKTTGFKVQVLGFRRFRVYCLGLS